jgi:hypothetical protein
MIELKEFDINKLKYKYDFLKILIIGRRNVGKSTLIKNILNYKYSNNDSGTVISNYEIPNLFPKINWYDEYDIKIVENVLAKQYKLNNPLKKQTFIVMHNCLYDEIWSRDKIMRTLFLNGRHLKTSFIISMQYPLGVPPVLRENIDHVFIFREPNTRCLDKLYDNYGGMFPTFELFCEIMDKLYDNYCLVIDNTSRSTKLEDRVFWYKAKELMYDYEDIKEKTPELNKEFIEWYYHPNRMDKWNWELEED